ncbi:hypothetical protein U1Q18_004231 [Sarracenia purpurea var. burkii]
MDEGVGKNDQLFGLEETVIVHFDRVGKDRQWVDFFPKWIDENAKEGQTLCPKIPMPKFEDYYGLDVVIARIPCEGGAKREGVKDVLRLQLNLVVANLLVRNGQKNHDDRLDRTVYAVFIGSCGPMREIFRCEDLLLHEDDVLVYRPNLRKLKQKVLMPVGACQVAPPHEEPGEEMLRRSEISVPNTTLFKPREAYVTVLHSSESFVCGAIALAQTLIQTNTTKDLVLLADDSISKTSLQGLREAGWKIKHTERIRSPSNKRKMYSEWNYSKLRVWQLTEYDKIICIDSDLVVLENIDDFFVYPQLSAVGEADLVFNSGVMLVEPSECTFKTLMEKMFEVESYDATDQGFLNEMFTWWHRWPSRINSLTLFDGVDDKEHEMMGGNPYAIHYLGIKPWMCQTDHDCNWDIPGLDRFASNSAHGRWLRVYEALPERLKWHCERTIQDDPTLVRIRKWRDSYKNGNGKIYLVLILLDSNENTIAFVASLASVHEDIESDQEHLESDLSKNKKGKDLDIVGDTETLQEAYEKLYNKRVALTIDKAKLKSLFKTSEEEREEVEQKLLMAEVKEVEFRAEIDILQVNLENFNQDKERLKLINCDLMTKVAELEEILNISLSKKFRANFETDQP